MKSLLCPLATTCCFLSVMACSGRSALDEYEDGVPSIVPRPIAGQSDESSEPAIGAACEDDDDCDGDAVCLEQFETGDEAELPGGYCTEACDDDSDCPEGAGCDELFETCLVRCEDDSDCREDDGYVCSESPGDDSRTYCLPDA